MKNKKWIYALMIIVLVGATSLILLYKNNVFYKVGDVVDSFNGINVYYNASVSNVEGRNLSKDNYNIGLKYQCVEFVKRYYYEYLNHKMPNSYGHAKDFFNTKLKDGEYNKDRNLIQYSNPSLSKPKVNDLIIFGATRFNSYGHVAIVSKVMGNEIEIIQQNPGRYGKSRATFELVKTNNKWKIISSSVLGRLRKP
ncbi:CHAP domain-containing protein [Aestuariivivens sp. NBU2969]|uniref:CHAP domain-containing protein n=1 Tax=Aestuariivivens sp. NBU2969 TaxID=2873267 RepID=UPI001CC18667|nr:CHAP domain-containing protein [Aestuariivivens sp. NBU2969]